MVVTSGAVRHAKLRSNRHHQQTNIKRFTGRMPFLSPNQQCQSTEGKIPHYMDLLTPSSPGVFQLCLWPVKDPAYLGGVLICLSSALWRQYPCVKAIEVDNLHIGYYHNSYEFTAFTIMAERYKEHPACKNNLPAAILKGFPRETLVNPDEPTVTWRNEAVKQNPIVRDFITSFFSCWLGSTQ